jgi:hypothetical protein
MSKNLENKMDKLINIFTIADKCVTKNCSQQKNNIMADKKASNLYHDFTMLKDIDRKIKLMNEYTDNKIIYEYEKCVFNHCKKIYYDLIKLLKSLLTEIPYSNPKRAELENMIIEIETSLNKNTSFTKKEYKMYIINISKLLHYFYNS